MNNNIEHGFESSLRLHQGEMRSDLLGPTTPPVQNKPPLLHTILARSFIFAPQARHFLGFWPKNRAFVNNFGRQQGGGGFVSRFSANKGGFVGRNRSDGERLNSESENIEKGDGCMQCAIWSAPPQHNILP